jgi:hypothetical protein
MLGIAPASADQMTLTGNDVLWDGVGSSPVFTVGIENTAGTTDPLLAWSLGLEIVPSGRAIGTVEFGAIVDPTLNTDYLLYDISSGLSAVTLPATSIAPIGDNASNFPTGVVVPASGKFLLQTTFVASSGASGIFDIVVHADEFSGS